MNAVTADSPHPEDLLHPMQPADDQTSHANAPAPLAAAQQHELEFDLDADASPYALLAPLDEDDPPAKEPGDRPQPDPETALDPTETPAETSPARPARSQRESQVAAELDVAPGAAGVRSASANESNPEAGAAETDEPVSGFSPDARINLGSDNADASGALDPRDHHIEFGPAARPVRRLMPLAAPIEDEPSDVPGKRRPTTVADYENRVKLLYRHAGARRTSDPQIPHAANPLEVVEDLIASTTGTNPRSPASWRVNRAALLYHLAANRHRSDKFLDAYELLSNASARLAETIPETPTTINLPPGHYERKSRRRQGIPLDDLIILLNTLGELNTPLSQVGSYVQFWLQAGVAAGPRVAEWTGVNWLDRSKGLLSVPNAKLKAAKPASWALKAAREAGRVVRTVHDLDTADVETADYSAKRAKRRIVRVSQEDALWVDLHLSAMWAYITKCMAQGAAVDDAFKNYYDRCRNLLLTACKIAFKGERSYTLRMTRSQYAANAKREFTLEEVAEMMGHTVALTTRMNYAPRHHGWRRGGQDDRQAATQRQAQAKQETAAPRPDSSSSITR